MLKCFDVYLKWLRASLPYALFPENYKTTQLDNKLCQSSRDCSWMSFSECGSPSLTVSMWPQAWVHWASHPHPTTHTSFWGRTFLKLACDSCFDHILVCQSAVRQHPYTSWKLFCQMSERVNEIIFNPLWVLTAAFLNWSWPWGHILPVMSLFSLAYEAGFFLKLFIYYFLAVLGLPCCAGFSLVTESRGYSLAAVSGLLSAVASLLVEHGL